METKDSSLYSIDTCRALGMAMACAQISDKFTAFYVRPDLIPEIRKHLPEHHFTFTRDFVKDGSVKKFHWKTTSEFPVDPAMLYEDAETYTKRVEPAVKQLPHKKLLAFAQAFISFNGKEEKNGTHVLHSTSRQLMADIAEILAKIGIKHTVSPPSAPQEFWRYGPNGEIAMLKGPIYSLSLDRSEY